MEVKVLSKERRGREPLRQLPGKWSSDVVCTIPLQCQRERYWSDGHEEAKDWLGRRLGMVGEEVSQFCKCILTVGPFGALLIHTYRSFPLRASKKRTLLQL